MSEQARLIAAWNEQCRQWKVECGRLRRDNKRLKAWLLHLSRFAECRRMNFLNAPAHGFAGELVVFLRAALRGDAPPRKRARRGA